ncbi:MAG: cytochrome c biogenesis protein CcsA [Bryobacterales bacterium]|nr:cytochrome c biogenesis protein [Bryobacteraceae bacterium]MDW8355193.1 cytochrome c biogenesis protein CcsA [Bryobacterales bacterium]
MPDTSTMWLRVAAVLYAAGLVHALAVLLRRSFELFRPAMAAFTVGVVLHMVSIVEDGIHAGHFPLNNFYESVSLCAFLIAVVFLVVYWRYEFATLSVFLFPLVFVLTLLGALESPVASWSSRAVRDAWLTVHVALVLLGYAALLVMTAASLAYLIQERHLKHKRPTAWFARLPPLGTLDELISKSMALGFVLITLAVVAGSTWASVESGTRWIREPKVVVALFTWVFYLAMVFLRINAGWRGRKAALLALTVVACSALTWVTHSGLRNLLTGP